MVIDLFHDDKLNKEFSRADNYINKRSFTLNADIEELKQHLNVNCKDTGDLVAFMYDHCVACAEEYTDWTARRAVKEIAKNSLVVIAIITLA